MPYPDWAAEVDRSGDGSVRHFMTEPHTPAAIQFAATVPRWAYATDSLKEGIWRQDRAIALSSRYIQTNASHLLRYLTFDIDWPGAYFAASDGILPPPNWIAEDRQNGRAHLGYELAAPVAKSDAARVGPLRYLAAVERGMTRRLEADPGYAGFVTKNPLSQHWRTTWLSVST